MPVAARQSCSTSQVHTTEIPPLDKARLLLGLGWGWAGGRLQPREGRSPALVP